MGQQDLGKGIEQVIGNIFDVIDTIRLSQSKNFESYLASEVTKTLNGIFSDGSYFILSLSLSLSQTHTHAHTRFSFPTLEVAAQKQESGN